MKKYLYLFFVLIATIWSCSSDEEVSFDSNLSISFSTDTISFDTLLSDAQSNTMRLLVFNPNQSAIQFSEISLARGVSSDYKVIINGKDTDQVFDEVLLGGDSLLILVEVDVDPRNENDPYLVKDSIVFNWNGNFADIKLVSWGEDGESVNRELLCDVTWTSERPYVLSDTVVVDAGCQLTIEPGARIYFENNAALFIQGSLVALGDSASHITFTNSRFDSGFDQVPGQWNGIYFLEGSANNQIAFADISNGQIGLRVGTPDDDDIPDLVITNTTIFNMSNSGILAFTSDIEMTNSLIYNCAVYLGGHFIGGNYVYRHCTFSNDPTIFVLDEPALQFADNIVVSESEIIAEDLFLELTNCIVWGSAEEELDINNGGERTIIAALSSNIIRSEQELQGNYTSQEFNFPGFKDPFSFSFELDSLAFARDIALDLDIENDIVDAKRDSLPDIGAYEWVKDVPVED